MNIRVDFSLRIDASALPALRELANADELSDVILFVKGEAQQGLCTYLEDNGVPVEVTRDVVQTY